LTCPLARVEYAHFLPGRCHGDHVLLFQAILLFLFPVGLYCLVLANINRRQRPLLLSGAWDALLMLAAGAGFFLVLVPALLDLLYHRSVAGAAGGDESFTSLWLRWWLLWVGYYLVLTAAAVALIVWRRHKTVIYNVDTQLFPAAFVQAGRLAGLECQAHPDRPGRYTLRPADQAVRAAEVDLEMFPSGCHVTLHWAYYAPALRLSVEQQLDKLLDEVQPADNPLAGWFLVISALIFALISLVVVAVYLHAYFPRR
jgi:hypothetical protein